MLSYIYDTSAAPLKIPKTFHLQRWLAELIAVSVMRLVLLALLPLLLLYLVPDLRVDPQGSRQGEAGASAGDPAAHRARDGADGALQLGKLLEAGGAESVFAVEEPGDALAAGILITAHHALEFFIDQHGDIETRYRDD